MATFNVPVYDSPVTQNRQQFQPYSLSQPVQNPNFTQPSPSSSVVGFYTSTPQNINSVMQPMVNPYLDANCKLDDLTQKVNIICDKLSTPEELSKKISTFDRTVQNLVKTVEKMSKRVDDVEQEVRRQRKKAYFKRDRLFIEGIKCCPSKKDNEKNDEDVPRRQYNEQGARPKKFTQKKKKTTTQYDDKGAIHRIRITVEE
ncbi:unnamed protein product [Mytilus coruscus]|uniref:Uncharacterized protein n=1 Tax=Mytilus coruscus TaxID=42192 RepID=A0A6J8CML6_MYTCO|nr:unnamed protein product [Mytilus coruscus]